jgi:predicted amidohydrolase YtcJ
MNYPTKSSLVIDNAHIYTMDPSRPFARGLSVQAGRIHSLRNDVSAQHFPESKLESIDLEGRFILPGLCDAHIHLEKYALMLDQVDCETPSLAECLARVAARCSAAEQAAWVLGHGWNQNDWGGFGSVQELDAVSSDNPVYLTAKSLHAGWANSKALALCGLTASTEDPPKGRLQRDDRGQLTGVLFEDAMRLISDKLPKPEPSDLKQRIARAQAKLNEWGITAIHDFDGLGCYDALKQLEHERELRLRVLKHIRRKDFEAALGLGLKAGATTDWIRIGHLKLFADGALGPRTAAMLQGYETEADNLGMLQLDMAELVEIGSTAIPAGFPLSIHAIGDRANRTALDAFEKLKDLEQTFALPFPHRIEHAQLLDPADINRPSSLGITVSMQPIHAISDQPMADLYWGERVRWSYAWNSQFQSGAMVIFGSDAPVETPDPWLGLHAAIMRQPVGSSADAAAWVAEERVSAMDAFRAYTTNPAQSSSWGSSLGQLSEDSCADLIVLDKDPMRATGEELKQLRPSGVLVDGEWVFRNF